jgi:chromosome segregation protein
LGKVDAQLQERRRQLEKLEEDRSDALRHKGLIAQKQKHRIDILAWSIIKGRLRIEAINETLVQRAEEASNLEKELVEVETGITTTDTEIETIDADIDQITGGDSAKISEQYGIVSAAVNHVRSDLERAQSEMDRTNDEKAVLLGELDSTQSDMNKNEQLMKEKGAHLDTLEKEISSTAAQIIRLEEMAEREQSSYYETTLRLQDLNNQLRSLDEGVSEIRSSIKSNSRELGLAYEEVRDSTEGLGKAEEELTGLSQVIPERQETLRANEALEESKKKEFDSVTDRLKITDAEVDESARVVAATREELIKVQARQEALKEAEDAFLKKQRAVARVLELRDSGEITGIHGTVAELGTIDQNYSVAIEIAGGNRLSYIVVDNDNVATTCVEVLKQERVGRASFIPLDKIKTQSPRNLPKDEGVVDFALNLVKFDAKMRPAFEFVFSDTIVTRDFATAKRLGFHGQRAVSLEGELVERSGLMTGGYYQRGGTGLSLQVEDTSPEIIERLKGLESILADLRAKQDALRNERRTLEKELQDLSNINYRARLELNNFVEREEEQKNRAETLQEKITKANLTISELENQIKELRERDNELTVQRERVMAQRDQCNEDLTKSDSAKLNQDIRDLKEVQEQYQKQREKMQGEIISLRVSIDERLGPKAIEIESKIQVQDSLLPGLSEQVTKLELALAERENEFVKLKDRREQIDEAVKDKRVHQLELKETLRNFRLRHEEIREAQTANEKAVYRLQTEQNRLESDIVGFNAELETYTAVDDAIDERKEQRELTYRELEEFDEKIKEIERELDAMGPVNLKALTDYDAERDRYDEILEKKTKLEEERKEILAFMEELEAEKTQKFLTVYNEIADNFARVFAKLSPEGEGNLMLENPEHPLMGGITVRSKPRGKDLVTLDAMSGGEKTLTGLALIFAIQMYNPASFYIFDEIDAALDNVNAHNVALLISEMAKSSQFVVVSLRDTTVRKADLLVGVANQDGISRIVSVDLEEVASEA